MEHDLKIRKEYLENLLSGYKKSEIRLNDRDYQVGDMLKFTKYEGVRDVFHYRFLITHIHSGLGMENNHVCLSVNRMPEDKND